MWWLRNGLENNTTGYEVISLTSFVVFGKSLSLFILSFPICNIRVNERRTTVDIS